MTDIVVTIDGQFGTIRASDVVSVFPTATGCVVTIQGVLAEALERTVNDEITRLRAALEAGPTSEKLSEALKATDYKYFGDYPLSDGQWDAVGILCAAARTLLNAKQEISR